MWRSCTIQPLLANVPDMRHLCLPILLLAGALLGSGASASTAGSAVQPLACFGGVGENCGVMELAQTSCAAVAAQAARQRGGEVIGAPRTFRQGEREMCEFTILIPDRSGEKPPRRERVVIELR